MGNRSSGAGPIEVTKDQIGFTVAPHFHPDPVRNRKLSCDGQMETFAIVLIHKAYSECYLDEFTEAKLVLN